MASAAPTPTIADVLAKLDALVGRKSLYQTEINNWLAGAAKGGPAGDGRYPLTDGTGYTRMVASPASIAAFAGTRVKGPEFWGAIGDGKSHPARDYFASLAACQAVYPFAVSLAQEMDFLAWQSMVDSIGEFLCPGTAIYKMCNGDPDSQQPLDWCAGRSDVDAAHATLDWMDMRMKTTTQHMFDNWNFATADGWVNSTAYDESKGEITYATFNQGAAIGTDINDGTRAGIGPYYAFGHPINPPKGRYRVYVEGTITRGVSYDHKNVNPPYGYISFSNQYGPDRGQWPATQRYLQLNLSFDKDDPVGTPSPFSGVFDINIDTPTPGYIIFKGGGYMNVRVTRLDIMPWVSNCAILNNRDRTPDHNFMAKRFRRANLLGPLQSGKDWVGLTCGLWKSFVSLDGDLQDWEQIRTYGWDSAAEWSDGAYLLHYYHCYMLSEGRGMYFAEGSFNAGENIKFFGGVAAAGNYIFNNPGSAEITLFGTATDYSGKGLCVNNAGLIRLIGTRHEQYLPNDAPVWHNTTGRVIYEASFVLFAGSVGTVLQPQAKQDTTSASIEFHSTQIYNMSSAKGLCSVGPGRMEFFGFINNGNPNIGLELITETASQDLLAGAGLFEPRPTNEVYFNNMPPRDITLQGGLFNLPYAPKGMIDQWNSDDTKLTVVSDFSYQGTRSLRVDKNGNYDPSVLNQIQIWIPIPHPGNVLGRMRFLFPNAIDPNAHPEFYATDPVTGLPKFPYGVPVYFRYFWVQQIGTDALGRPIMSARSQFKGEQTISVPLAGSPDWIKRAFNSLYQPPSDSENQLDKAPFWATHWMIAIDAQSIPPSTFYIDGLQANFIG